MNVRKKVDVNFNILKNLQRGMVLKSNYKDNIMFMALSKLLKDKIVLCCSIKLKKKSEESHDILAITSSSERYRLFTIS